LMGIIFMCNIFSVVKILLATLLFCYKVIMHEIKLSKLTSEIKSKLVNLVSYDIVVQGKCYARRCLHSASKLRYPC